MCFFGWDSLKNNFIPVNFIIGFSSFFKSVEKFSSWCSIDLCYSKSLFFWGRGCKLSKKLFFKFFQTFQRRFQSSHLAYSMVLYNLHGRSEKKTEITNMSMAGEWKKRLFQNNFFERFNYMSLSLIIILNNDTQLKVYSMLNLFENLHWDLEFWVTLHRI